MLYVDASALLKHYVKELGSDAINRKLAEQSAHYPGVFMSVVGFAEILATFARRLRENPTVKKETVLLYKQFRDDWMHTWTQVELTVGVLAFVPRLVARHPLKALDAIHLASALWLSDALRLGKYPAGSSPLLFACSDRQLGNAARAEGLQIFDPLSVP